MAVINLHPKAGDILAAYGLHCFHCAFNAVDSIEAGARAHGLDDEDIENIVTDLNEFFETLPAKPQRITVTDAAAVALGDIAKKEGKTDHFLTLIADDSGGFCMEFRPSIEGRPEQAKRVEGRMQVNGDQIFTAPGVPHIKISASPQTLAAIGGATVDFRDGRFKLDLPKGGCGCNGEDCACKNTKSEARNPKERSF